MGIALAFWILAVLCVGYAARFGGRDGRLIAVMYLAAVVATLFAQRIEPDWNDVNIPVMIVDVALMVALYWLALRSDRYWPLWAAGFHLLTIVAHVAAMVLPALPARVYFGAATVWSIPTLLVLAIGVTLDLRAGIGDRAGLSP